MRVKLSHFQLCKQTFLGAKLSLVGKLERKVQKDSKMFRGKSTIPKTIVYERVPLHETLSTFTEFLLRWSMGLFVSTIFIKLFTITTFGVFAVFATLQLAEGHTRASTAPDNVEEGK